MNKPLHMLIDEMKTPDGMIYVEASGRLNDIMRYGGDIHAITASTTEYYWLAFSLGMKSDYPVYLQIVRKEWAEKMKYFTAEIP